MPTLEAIVTAQNISVPFTGGPIPYTSFTVSPSVPVTVTYKQESSDPTTIPPIYPGEYSVEVVVDEGFGYYGAAIADFTITKAPATITFAAISDKTFGDAPFALNASSTSGSPVTLVADNSSALSVSGTQATLLNVGPGFVNITASESSPYHQAVPVTRKVNLLKANQVITATTPSNINTRTIPFQISAGVTSGLPIVYALLQGPVTLTPSGFVSVLDDGPVVIKLEQPGSQNYNPTSLNIGFTITPFVQTFQEGVSPFLGTASQRESCPTPTAQDFLLCEPTPGVWPSIQNQISGLWERVEIWWEYVKKTENW